MAVRGRPRGFDRQQALRRAMELFWAKGYDGTSLADLTAAMGLKPPSLYAAFGSKQALFREAVALYLEAEGGGIWDGLEAAPSARAAVAGMLQATAEAFTRGPEPMGCMIVLAAPHNESGHPAVCDELKGHRLANVALLERRFARAVAEGELPPDTDCRALADTFATLQHGMSIQARDGASRATLKAIAECAMAGWEGIVAGAAARRPPPPPGRCPE